MIWFGRALFEGSRFVRWTVGTAAALGAIGFGYAWYTNPGMPGVFLVVESALVLLALATFFPERCRWASRGFSAIIFLVAALVTATQAVDPSGSLWVRVLYSVMGLAISVPSLIYAVRGRWLWQRSETHSASEPDGVDHTALEKIRSGNQNR